MPVKAKHIKDLPLKNELDGSESLLVQDSNGTKQAPLGTIVDEIESGLLDMIGTKRDVNVKLTKDDMDISSDSVRLGLQNLNDEVHALLRGSGGSVNAEILPGSITTELLADGCVTNEKNSDNGLFLNQNTIYPLVNINESELNRSNHKNPVKKGILDIKILNANMNYDYKLCYIAKNNAMFGDLILINAMNKDGSKAYGLFPSVKTTYPNNGIQTHYLTAQSPYKEKVIITLNYDHLAEVNDFQSHDDYPSFRNRIAKQCLIPSSTVDYDEALFDSVTVNKGKDFPLVISDTVVNKNEITKALLDIKIMNAKKNHDYKVKYITKNQSKFYGDLILITRINRETKAESHLFDTKNITYPITDRNGISTLVLNAEFGNETVILTIDYSAIPDGFVPLMDDIDTNVWQRNIVHPSQLILETEIPQNSLHINYDEALFDSVTVNKGKDFPLVISDTVVNKNEITNALLDIKIMNAKKNHDYKVRYITKNQSKFFGDLILINRINRETKAESHLFDTKNITYPITDRNGISTLVLNAENGTETVILTIDYSAIPDGFVPLMDDIDTNVWQRNIVHPSQLILETEIPQNEVTNCKKSLHVNYSKSSEVIKVTAKSGLTHDVELDFLKVKPNNLMAVWYGKIGKNSKPYPLPISSSVANLGSGSDWIGPYIVKAINNGDGNGRIYTGGSHSKENTMTGDATARTKRYKLFVDGVLMTEDFNGYCSSFELHVENEIMGYNTRDLNRYILLEKVHYSMVDSELKVKVDIFPLEDIVIEEYYGMQIVSGTLDSVYYLGGENGENDSPQGTWQNHNSGANNFVDTMLINKDGIGGVFMKMDKTCGLGVGQYIPNDLYHCHTSDYGKSYFNLIRGNTNQTPDHLFWKGSYEFKTL